MLMKACFARAFGFIEALMFCLGLDEGKKDFFQTAYYLFSSFKSNFRNANTECSLWSQRIINKSRKRYIAPNFELLKCLT